VQGDVGVLFEEGGDELGLVRREVVADDVDLSSRLVGCDDVSEEVDELAAGMARGRARAAARGLDGRGLESRSSRRRKRQRHGAADRDRGR